jgi:hypothetical protein
MDEATSGDFYRALPTHVVKIVSTHGRGHKPAAALVQGGVDGSLSSQVRRRDR